MSRKVRVEVRFSRLELYRIRKAASRAGLTVEEWCLRVMRKAVAEAQVNNESRSQC